MTFELRICIKWVCLQSLLNYFDVNFIEDQFVFEITRMIYVEHTNLNIVLRHYLSRNNANGQQIYFSNKRRTLVKDLFRELIVSWNSRLWQCLSAEKQYMLEDASEFRRLKEQIVTLKDAKDKKSVRSRKTLYNERRRLKN